MKPLKEQIMSLTDCTEPEARLMTQGPRLDYLPIVYKIIYGLIEDLKLIEKIFLFKEG